MKFFAIIVCFVMFMEAGCIHKKDMTKREKSSIAHYKLGVSFLNDSMLQLAFVEFQKASEKNSKNEEVQYALGHIYYIWGMFPDAEVAFLKAITLNDNYSEAHNYLGKVYVKENKPDLAIEEYKNALANPQYLTPHLPLYNMGMLYMESGNFKQSRETFEGLLKRFPQFILPYNRLAEISMQEKEFDVAEKILKLAMNILPDFSDSYIILAKVYLEEGRVELAKQTLTKVVDRFAGTPAVLEATSILEKL